MSATKAWTPEQLLTHIKDVCGSVVTEKLQSLNQTVTKHQGWIEGAGAGLVPKAPALEKGLAFAGVLAALAHGGGKDKGLALGYAKDKGLGEHVVKALEASTGTAGGFLLAPEVSSDFIDLLTARAIFRSFGTPVLDMDTGVMQVSKLTAASTAYYQGENRNLTKSQQDFGMKQLSAKKLTVLVPISNDLIRRGGPRVNTIVRNDALRSASLKEDVTFIRSAGGAYAPKGIRYQLASANVLTANSSVSLANTTYDLGQLVLALEEANVAFTNPGWMFAPRTKQYLMTVRDGLGNYAFRAEMLTGKLWGYPFKTTTQIPRNLGGDGDESEIYLADFDDIIIGQTLTLEVAMSTEASYLDENNELVSAFSLDQTLMRVIMEHDLVMRHDESAAVLTGVTWAPTGS